MHKAVTPVCDTCPHSDLRNLNVWFSSVCLSWRGHWPPRFLDEIISSIVNVLSAMEMPFLVGVYRHHCASIFPHRWQVCNWA